MLFRQIKHRQLQDVQLYGTLRGVPSRHIAVSSLEMLTASGVPSHQIAVSSLDMLMAKLVPSPLSFTYFILINQHTTNPIR